MYLNGNPIRLIHETVSRFSRGPRGIVRVPVIKGDWASSEGRLVLGFVLIVVSGARITRRLAGFSVADRVVRMVGRRIVFAGLGVGPGPIVTLGVVELMAARFAPGRIRGVRGPGRVQDGSRSRGRDEDDGEDAQQGIYQFDASYKGHRNPGDSLSCTVIEMITAASKPIQCRRALGPRDGRLGRPRLGPRIGPIVPGGVVRGAGRPPAVRPAGTRGPPVDRVRPPPRDEPAPRPRRLRERDRRARPREPEPDPLGRPRP